MELTVREDIDVPIEQAFKMISDFEIFERAALRRGAEVERLDDLLRPGVGAKWRVNIAFRGKSRLINLAVTEFNRPTEVQIHAEVQGVRSDTRVELVALSRTCTRLNVWMGLKAKSLTARLLLRSLKLARSTLTQRLEQRVSSLGRDMEERFSRMV